MPNIAILVANTEYRSAASLACCAQDLAAIDELIQATGRFPVVEALLNQESPQLKDRIRSVIDSNSHIEEIFFYFTGHGYQNEADFFFCATNFDVRRPNETGLSNDDLHTLLRPAKAQLVIKVIDACSSGALLFKADGSFLPPSKNAFKNIIQIASCLDSQSSLTGDPLSLFTSHFIKAALRKAEGTVYYTDIIDALRDEFLNNNSQTPHFVSQGTGREYLVENAKRFETLRAKLYEAQAGVEHQSETHPAVVAELTPLAILAKAEQQFAKKDRAQAFIGELFNRISERAKGLGVFQDLFDSTVAIHSDFREPTTRAFIISVLKGEKRPDNFVTAAMSQEQRRRDPFNLTSIAAMWSGSDSLVTHYDLTLNCSLEQAQLKVTLLPRFVSLKMFVLVITCAPSLESCYVFEMLSRHSLTDWSQFDSEGTELSRRWYKKNWYDNCDGLVEKVFVKLNEVIQENINSTAEALRGQLSTLE